MVHSSIRDSDSIKLIYLICLNWALCFERRPYQHDVHNLHNLGAGKVSRASVCLALQPVPVSDLQKMNLPEKLVVTSSCHC